MNFPSTAANGTQYVGLAGQGQAALINSSPNFVFANTVVGATSPAKTVTMSNINGSPVTLTVSGWELLGSCGTAVNVTTDNCTGAVLTDKTTNPANTCTMLLTFTPAAATTCTETLEVNSSGGNSPSTITMTGTGTLAAPTFSPKPFTFGKVTVGAQSTSPLTVTNPNPVPMAFTSTSMTAGAFQIVGDTCSGYSIAGNGTCSVNVTFSPTTTGALSGTLTVVDAGGTGTQTVAVNGSGGALTAPTFAPKPLAFGAVTVGTPSTLSVTATNNNVVPMQFTSTSTSNTDYQIVGDTCSGNSVPASGGTCSISITFTPLITGTDPGVLTVVDAGGSGSQTVNLSGSGH